MDPVDKLLAELKAEQAKQTPPTTPPLPQESTSPPIQPDVDDLPVVPKSLDDLLSQLGEGEKKAVRSQLSNPQPLPPLPPLPSSPVDWQQVDALLDQSFPQTRLPAPGREQTGKQSPGLPLLDDLKAEYDAQDVAERQKWEQEQREAERRRQQQEREKQRRLQELQAKRRAALTEQAKQWLKTLNPRSEEGLWFEEFSCNYPSRLEAAVEYLEALEAVKRESRLS